MYKNKTKIRHYGYLSWTWIFDWLFPCLCTFSSWKSFHFIWACKLPNYNHTEFSYIYWCHKTFHDFIKISISINPTSRRCFPKRLGRDVGTISTPKFGILCLCPIIICYRERAYCHRSGTNPKSGLLIPKTR